MTCNVDLIIDKLKHRKNELGWTNKKLAAEAGVSEGTLNKILGTETKDPSISNILKMISALGLSQDYVFDSDIQVTISEKETVLTEDERRLLDLFRQLPPKDQGSLLGRAELLVEQHREAETEDAG